MWNLLSLNVNGLNDRIKRTALVDWLKCMKVDVACLQETHAPSHESIRKWFANSGFRVVSSSVSNKRCGSAILVKDSLNVKQVIRDDAGRFVQALVDFGEDQLSFISLYAPNKNPDRNAFFSSLTGLIDLTRPTFVCGDFNSVLNSDLDQLRRASYTGAAASRAQDCRPALQSLLSHTETYRCGELYILRKQPIRGCTHLAPLRRASIWSGPHPVLSSLFANASTILLSFPIISTCWSSLSLMIVLVMVPEYGNLTHPSWTM